MKKILSLGLFLLLCACAKNAKTETNTTADNRLPYFTLADFTPRWYDDPKDLIGKHKIPPFAFTNQNGETVTNATYKNKIYIADFFFTTCPGICPKLTKNMGDIQERFKANPDILLLSHTVMPWRDSIPVLKAYEKDNHIDGSKWNLVTGDKDELYEIARQGYFADEDFIKTQDESEFIHTENFILIDGQGYIRGVYNGTIPIDVKRLIRHVEILKKESNPSS